MPTKKEQMRPEFEKGDIRHAVAWGGGKARCWMVLVLIFASAHAVAADFTSTVSGVSAQAKTPEQVEYELKAAFIYNFMRFIEWPAEKQEANQTYQAKKQTPLQDETPSAPPLMIGIIGKNPFGQAFIPVLDRKINNRKIELVEIDRFEVYAAGAKSIEEAAQAYRKKYAALLQRCDILFFCSSEAQYLDILLPMTTGSAAATISDIPEFTLRGGMIEFVTENNHLRFDIHLAHVEKEKLTIRSQLLELARRICKKPNDKQIG
jgi:hypothetical protein